MSDFKNRVTQVIRLVPEGKVVSYGQVALYVGTPRAARQVGWILRQSGHKDNLPWWRVINNEGRISIKGNLYLSPHDQKRFLQEEGVEVHEDLTLDIEKYRFVANKDLLKKLQLPDHYIEILLQRYLPFTRSWSPIT